MSNYNYGLEPGIRGNGSSRLRFALIFVVISAVTAALVWWFWPGSEEVVPGKKSDLQKQEQQVKKADPPTETVPGDSGRTTDSGSVSLPENEKKISSSEKAPAVTGDGGKKEVKPVADPTDPPLPDKGVITPADQKGKDLPVIPVDKAVSEEQQKALHQASLLLGRKDYAGAGKLAEKALENTAENSAFYRKAWKILTQARMGMVFYGKESPYVVSYRIRSGDTLSGVANRFFTTVELLRKRNNISGSRIFVGRKLYIVPGDWKIIVSKKFRLLKLYRKKAGSEKLFAVWEIGIGRMGKTPAAEFAIAARVRHPDWYLPDGRVLKYGDAGNQLGDYFLKLAPSSAPGRPLLGYGIHGAGDESTVGRSLSSGCIRMRNVDVEYLYYLVPAGCRVTITEE